MTKIKNPDLEIILGVVDLSRDETVLYVDDDASLHVILLQDNKAAISLDPVPVWVPRDDILKWGLQDDRKWMCANRDLTGVSLLSRYREGAGLLIYETDDRHVVVGSLMDSHGLDMLVSVQYTLFSLLTERWEDPGWNQKEIYEKAGIEAGLLRT